MVNGFRPFRGFKMSSTTFKCKVCGMERKDVTPFTPGLLKCCKRFLYNFDHNHVYDKDWRDLGHIKYVQIWGRWYPALLLSDMEHYEGWNKEIVSIDDYEAALAVFIKEVKIKEK